MRLNYDERQSLTMNEISQYHRVSTESDDDENDEELGRNLIQPFRIQIANARKQRHPNVISWNMQCICQLFVLYILLMVALGFAISRMPPIHHDMSSSSHHEEMKHHAIYTKAAVAAGQEECSKVGVTILKEGGNAVDAAIATMLCDGVVEPEYCGIGGGFFMVIYNKTTNSSTVIDARETAPKQSTRNMLVNASETATSPLSIGVPGELKGYSYAYHKYGGGVSWKRLFKTAIDKAGNGFPIGEQLALKLEKLKDKIIKTKALCDVFCDSTRNDVKRAKDIAKNPNLANTLKLVSEQGVESFYSGRLASTMASEIRRDNGILTEEDFSTYLVKERMTLRVNLSSDMALLVPPLPSGGPIVGMILSVMDSYKVNHTRFESSPSLYWHRTVESMKHAFGKRTHFGDPEFVADANNLAAKFLSDNDIANTKEKIKDDKTFSDTGYYGATKNFEKYFSSSTSQVSVLAPNGDAVSITSSVNTYFGSLFMSPTSGVLFNNEMEDFATQVQSVPPEVSIPNMIEPGKRPLSSMAPTIVLNAKTNEVVFIIGAAGGKQIPTSIAISLLRLLYFGTDDFDDAIRKPRLHHQLVPNVVKYEKEFEKDVIEALAKIGHKVEEQPPKSHVNGIKNHVSHIHAFSDLRSIGAGADGW